MPYDQLDQDLQSASALPDYSFISPDMCNDTHDCPISTGDDWLSREVPKILGSPAFTTQNSLLVVTWDEGSKEDNRVATVLPARLRGKASPPMPPTRTTPCCTPSRRCGGCRP